MKKPEPGQKPKLKKTLILTVSNRNSSRASAKRRLQKSARCGRCYGEERRALNRQASLVISVARARILFAELQNGKPSVMYNKEYQRGTYAPVAATQSAYVYEMNLGQAMTEPAAAPSRRR